MTTKKAKKVPTDLLPREIELTHTITRAEAPDAECGFYHTYTLRVNYGYGSPNIRYHAQSHSATKHSSLVPFYGLSVNISDASYNLAKTLGFLKLVDDRRAAIEEYSTITSFELFAQMIADLCGMTLERETTDFAKEE